MHDALEQVQSKIAYLERAVSELSDVVFRQHGEIQALQLQLSAMRDRLLTAEPEARTPEQERPPHY